MEPINLSFGKLLEQYVFSVAKNYIDLVDEDTQANLIKLFIGVGNEPNPEPIPARQKRLYQNERIQLIERLIRIHQDSIEATFHHIRRIDMLIKRVKKTITNKVTRKGLIDHYESLKNKYLIYLVNVQTLQQQEFRKLESYLV